MSPSNTRRDNIDYTKGDDTTPADHPTVESRIDTSARILRTAVTTYDDPLLFWKGGKDSTLTAFLLWDSISDTDQLPTVIFATGDNIPERYHTFVSRWAREWGFDVQTVHTSTLPDATLPTITTDDTTDTEHTMPGDAAIIPQRPDEDHTTRSGFFTHITDSEAAYDIVNPVWQYYREDVWEATWDYMVPKSVDTYPADGHIPRSRSDLPEGIDIDDIPVLDRYFRGAISTRESEHEYSRDKPGWLQRFTHASSSFERAKDTDPLEERLHALGYR